MSRPFGVALLMAGYDDRGAQVCTYVRATFIPAFVFFPSVVNHARFGRVLLEYVPS